MMLMRLAAYLVLLVAASWASPPVIPGPLSNALEVLPGAPLTGECGGRFACKSTSQCSVWYAEFNALPPEPCLSLQGFQGLCCPDIVLVKSKVPKFPESIQLRVAPPLPPIPPLVIEQTSRSSRIDLAHMNEVEENLSRTPMMIMRFNSMAMEHSNNMAPVLAAKFLSDRALLVVNAARRLQERLGLSPIDAGLGLQVIDTRAALLEDTCLPPPVCLPLNKYRTFDGSCNNLIHPNWGRALTPMERHVPPVYDDGIWSPRIWGAGRIELPNVRVVRSILVTDENHPVLDMTHMVMQWGQFVDHDMSHVPVFRTSNQSNIDCCTPEGGVIPPEMRHPHCFPIEIPPQDPFYGPRGVRCLNFVRSVIAPRADCRIGYAEQMNQLSHFIDGSHIYGPDPETSRTLRQFAGGLLAVSIINGRPFLPQNPQARGCVGRAAGFACFVSGDSRTNQILGLTSLHVLFLRQHNLIAANLATINPQWGDEILYEETRRIVIAILQHITYNEFLPLILGRLTMDAYGLTPQTTGYSPSYDETVNPSITNEFSAAAFRMGHSLIQGHMNLIAADGSVRVELMRNWFDNPHLLRQPGQMDAVIRGLIDEWPQNMDEWVSEDVTNHLFQSPRRDFGFDLVSLNLWRGRDHGLPGYNTFRQVCGLPRVANFNELLSIMPKSVVDRMASLYKSVDDIDLYVGGLVEKHLPGSLLGPVFSCIIADQFARLKEGDRFFYEHGGHPNSFTPAQLQELRKMSLATVICDSSDEILEVQPLVFRSPTPSNPRVACKSPLIPRMNLQAWKV